MTAEVGRPRIVAESRRDSIFHDPVVEHLIGKILDMTTNSQSNPIQDLQASTGAACFMVQELKELAFTDEEQRRVTEHLSNRVRNIPVPTDELDAMALLLGYLLMAEALIVRFREDVTEILEREGL